MRYPVDAASKTVIRLQKGHQTSRGWDIDGVLLPPLELLLNYQRLPPQFRDHPLKGQWSGYREFHASSDWLVIYRVEGDYLVLYRTGTHADLYKR